MVLKVRAGGTYQNVKGEKIGPLEWDDNHFSFNGWHYAEDGHLAIHGRMPRAPWDEKSGTEHRDLVAEWVDTTSPVRTRKEIVPGKYGRLVVSASGTAVHVSMVSNNESSCWSREDVRAAAATLTEIADALETP